jgi:branched-chain amino acid transport system ATP-binding protein
MQAILVGAIKNLNKEAGITILISEQFARPVLPILERGYVIENGMLTMTGIGTELKNNPEIQAAYFGV